MSRNVSLDAPAISVLEAHQRKGESLSQVIKRLVPPPIRTFGDLENYLNAAEGPVLELTDLERARKRRKISHSN